MFRVAVPWASTAMPRRFAFATGAARVPTVFPSTLTFRTDCPREEISIPWFAAGEHVALDLHLVRHAPRRAICGEPDPYEPVGPRRVVAAASLRIAAGEVAEGVAQDLRGGG